MIHTETDLMTYDLFISYSRRDNADGRITQLVEHIKTDFANFEGNKGRELVPFFDQQEIHGMSDWRQRILQGLRESRLLLACLSPAYLQSEYCEWEFVEYLKYEIGHLHGFNGVAPIYFVEVPGWDSKDFEQQCAAWVAELRKRQNFDLRPWHDQGEDALRESAVQERMGKLNRQIVQTITRGERAEKSLGNVDAHNPHFIGRTANLRMLRENFVKPGHIGVVTAVNGVGGLGKTALAIEYAHAFADEYGGGRWQVRCAGKDDLRLALAELATPIGFEFTDDEKKNADLQFERTRRELKKLADAREPHRCMLLLDNVDRPSLLDPAQVARLNGGDWLHVLATTRLGENELHGAHRDRSFLAIDELPPDDALALIESYQPDGRFRSEAERDAAREIVRLLGSFTLAVESAAVYLGQFANDVTCAAFLARLKKEGLEGLDTAASQSSEGVLHGEKRLSATLQPTLERLGAAEKLVLEFAALLPPDQVPLPWLRALVAKTFPEMEHDAEPGYPDHWKNVVRRLLSLRLLQATDDADKDGQPRVVRVHRLVAALVFKMPGNESWGDFCKLLDDRCFEFSKSCLNIECRWELAPLVEMVHLWSARLGEGAFALLGGKLSNPLHRLGYIHQAAEFSTEAVKQIMAEPESKATKVTVGILSHHAAIARDFRQYAVAKTVLERAIKLGSRIPNMDKGMYAQCLSSLAIIEQDCGEFQESSEHYMQALEVLSPPSPEHEGKYAQILCNLGSLANDAGASDKACELLKDGISRLERTESPDLGLLACNYANLGLAEDALGNTEQALLLLEKALAIENKIYPSEHFLLGCRHANIATVRMSRKEWYEAKKHLEKVIPIVIEVYGQNHEMTAYRFADLAWCEHGLHNLPQAEASICKAIAIAEACSGFSPETLGQYLATKSVIRKEMGDSIQAAELMRRARKLIARGEKGSA